MHCVVANVLTHVSSHSDVIRTMTAIHLYTLAIVLGTTCSASAAIECSLLFTEIYSAVKKSYTFDEQPGA